MAIAVDAFALTFAYNETFFLPKWIDYYGSQLGEQNLFVLDHGSNDLSSLNLGQINVLRVPRSSYDEVQRVFFASSMHASLLQFYKAGFVVDVDEFLVADPRKYRNLADFAAASQQNALAAVGLELCHVRALESEYEESLPILSQRSHVIFDSWMCKRSFAQRPIRFGGGFHTSDHPVHFDEDLYLIHLKNFDYHYRLVRQEITSSWSYVGDFGIHARKPSAYVEQVFQGIDLRAAAGKISRHFSFRNEIEQCVHKVAVNPSGEYDFNLDGGFQTENLYILPERFRGLF